MTKTPEEYAQNPNHCPVCDSDDLDAGRMVVDEGWAWQPISCCECGSEWDDLYKLEGYASLMENKKEGA